MQIFIETLGTNSIVGAIARLQLAHRDKPMPKEVSVAIHRVAAGVNLQHELDEARRVFAGEGPVIQLGPQGKARHELRD